MADLFRGFKYFCMPASLNSDGVTFNANGDYSSGASFRLEARVSDYIAIHKMTVTIASKAKNADEYADLPALTNGIFIRLRTEDNIVSSLNSIPVKTNADWASHCDTLVFYEGSTDDYIVGLWSFAALGHPLIIKEDTFLEVLLQDDFTGISKHLFNFEGSFLDEIY